MVASDVEGLAVVGDAANDDMALGVAGIVMTDRYPIELRPQICLHLLHQIAGDSAQVGQFHPCSAETIKRN